MSAVSDKKDACGFQVKATPRVCSTCANFKSDRVLTDWMEQTNAKGMSAPERWRPKPYTIEQHGVEKNLRCKTHGFAVKKMSACRDWTPAEEETKGGAA